MVEIEWTIRAELIIADCINKGEVIAYAALAEAAMVPSPHRIHQLTSWLEELIRRDANLGLPIRAAVVVSKTNGLPGPGFFDVLDETGLAPGDDPAARHQHLLEQLSSPQPE